MSGQHSQASERAVARERANKVANWLLLLFVFLVILAVMRFTIWPILGDYMLR